MSGPTINGEAVERGLPVRDWTLTRHRTAHSRTWTLGALGLPEAVASLHRFALSLQWPALDNNWRGCA